MTETTSLSNRQYTMLQMFASEPKEYVMKMEAAQGFDQRAFRSMLIRRYVAWVPSQKGFRLTAEGRAAFHVFEATDITRRDPSRPLTAYFELKILGIQPAKKRSATAA